MLDRSRKHRPVETIDPTRITLGTVLPDDFEELASVRFESKLGARVLSSVKCLAA